jgi:ribonuclease G
VRGGRAGKFLPQMSKNLLVISVDVRETRVALIEGGIIAELHLERKNNPFAGSVGNVVLGKVTRVLPGLQAAFIDIGQERAAFLHVEDLIRPDDFDTYLQGGRKHASGAGTAGDEAPAEDEVEEAEAAAVEAGTNGAGGAMVAIPGAESVASLPDSPGESHGDVAVLAAASEPTIDPPTASEVASAASSTADLSRVETSSPDLGGDVDDEDGERDDEDDGGNGDADIEGSDADEGSDRDEDDRDEDDADADSDSADENGDRDSVPAPAEDAADVGEARPARRSSAPPKAAAASPLAGDELDLPGFTITEPGEPVPRAGAGARGRRAWRRRWRARARARASSWPRARRRAQRRWRWWRWW